MPHGDFGKWAQFGPLFVFLGMSVKDQVITTARQIAEPILARDGYELVDVEYGSEHGHWVLRLVIDKPGSRVGVDDCERASHAVDTALEVADVVDHAYSLEVSSPGLNRPLTRPEHFQRYLGRKVRIRTYGPLFDPPRKNFVGRLAAFAADEAEVDVDGAGRFRIPLDRIAKAHLEFDPNDVT